MIEETIRELIREIILKSSFAAVSGFTFYFDKLMMFDRALILIKRNRNGGEYNAHLCFNVNEIIMYDVYHEPYEQTIEYNNPNLKEIIVDFIKHGGNK